MQRLCMFILQLCSGVVWRARCLTNGDIVAVKMLNLEALDLGDTMHETQMMKVGVLRSSPAAV